MARGNPKALSARLTPKKARLLRATKRSRKAVVTACGRDAAANTALARVRRPVTLR